MVQVRCAWSQTYPAPQIKWFRCPWGQRVRETIEAKFFHAISYHFIPWKCPPCPSGTNSESTVWKQLNCQDLREFLSCSFQQELRTVGVQVRLEKSNGKQFSKCSALKNALARPQSGPTVLGKSDNPAASCPSQGTAALSKRAASKTAPIWWDWPKYPKFDEPKWRLGLAA